MHVDVRRPLLNDMRRFLPAGRHRNGSVGKNRSRLLTRGYLIGYEDRHVAEYYLDMLKLGLPVGSINGGSIPRQDQEWADDF